MRRSILEVIYYFETDIAEFIAHVLRLRLAMTREGPLTKTAKEFFSDLLDFKDYFLNGILYANKKIIKNQRRM